MNTKCNNNNNSKNLCAHEMMGSFNGAGGKGKKEPHKRKRNDMRLNVLPTMLRVQRRHPQPTDDTDADTIIIWWVGLLYSPSVNEKSSCSSGVHRKPNDWLNFIRTKVLNDNTGGGGADDDDDDDDATTIHKTAYRRTCGAGGGRKYKKQMMIITSIINNKKQQQLASVLYRSK